MSGELSSQGSEIWSPIAPREVYAQVCTEIARAADLLQAPRVLMVWGESEEPWIHLAIWSHHGFDVRQEPPGALERLVARPLLNRSFLCLDVGAAVPMVLYTSPTGPQRWFSPPLNPQLQEEFSIGAVLSPTLRGASFEGRLLFLDIRGLTADHLPRADLAACQVAANMDHFYRSQQSQQAAVTEERQRLARNLHDGLLQSLTVVSLQLKAVQRLLDGSSQTASDHLHEIQSLVADEQRDLRFLVQGLKSTARDSSETDLCLVARLETMSRQVERMWGLHVELNLKLAELRLPTALAYEIYYVVHEALLNAARHAHASAVYVELAVQNDQMRIVVSDNGHGFPFYGHYNLAELTDLHSGPVMLKERVTALGGCLSLDSSGVGARLEIRLPLLRPGDTIARSTPHTLSKVI
jgi:signal transduction histidine kinase